MNKKIIGYQYRLFSLGGKMVWSTSPPPPGAYEIEVIYG